MSMSYMRVKNGQACRTLITRGQIWRSSNIMLLEVCGNARFALKFEGFDPRTWKLRKSATDFGDWIGTCWNRMVTTAFRVMMLIQQTMNVDGSTHIAHGSTCLCKCFSPWLNPCKMHS